MSKRILVIQTAFIGDLILITPLVRGLLQVYPGCEVDVLASRKAGGVLTNHPGISKLFILDKRRKIFSMMLLLPALRRRGYSMVFLPHRSLTSAALALMAGIPVRAGFDRGFSRRLLTLRVPFRKAILRAEKNLDLLRAVAPGEYSIKTELFPSQEDMTVAGNVIRELPEGGKVIALAPGSVWPTKRWPAEYYRTLAEQLVERGFRLVFTGSPAEERLCREVMPGHGSVNAAGRLTLLETAALLKNCSLVISNDSGALHIANAVNTPAFAIFGPTVERFGYFPLGDLDRVFQIDAPCRPCGTHGGRRCPTGDHRCMSEILPESLLDAVEEFFGLL